MTTLVTNTGELQSRVLQIAGVCRPGVFKIAKVTPVVAKMILSDVKSNFNKSSAPDGTRWKALAHGRPSGGNPMPLLNNGLFRGSMTAKSTATEATVGTNYAQAGIHQFGGIIRATKAKFLAIPATKEAQRAGSPRKFPRPLTPIIGKSGKGVLVETSTVVRPRGAKSKTGVTSGSLPRNRSAGTVQFYLVKEVKILARPYLGFSPDLLKKVDEYLVDAALKQINGG